MLALYIYLGICLAIFCWFMLLGVHDFLFQPETGRYESNSFKNSNFWREALWMSLPLVNLLVLFLFIYIVIVGIKK
jgi:hypothetical protein